VASRTHRIRFAAIFLRVRERAKPEFPQPAYGAG